MPSKVHDDPKKENLRTLKFLGLELPLTNWAVKILAGIAVLAVLIFLYISLIDPYLTAKARNTNDLQLMEYQKHFSEPADWNGNALNGKIQISHYASDGCLLIGRRNSPDSALIQAWIIDPNRIPQQLQASPGKITENIKGDSIAEAQVCTGRCINPHPGQFKSWNGQTNGCWVQVWRQWPDGCAHYQWYNSCYGYWDTNPDGSAKVFWTCCVH